MLMVRVKLTSQTLLNTHPSHQDEPFQSDVKYFCPTGYNGQIFSAVTKLLEEKIEQVKRAGNPNAKTINAIECERFVMFSEFPSSFTMQLSCR